MLIWAGCLLCGVLWSLECLCAVLQRCTDKLSSWVDATQQFAKEGRMRRKEELKKRSEAVHAAAAFTPPATEFLSDTDIEAGRMSPLKDSGALPEAPLVGMIIFSQIWNRGATLPYLLTPM